MRRSDLRFVRDEELAQLCAPSPLENALQGAGCLGSAFLLILLFVSPLAELFRPAIAGMAVAVAAVFWIRRAAGRHKRACREELVGGAGGLRFASMWRKPAGNSIRAAPIG